MLRYSKLTEKQKDSLIRNYRQAVAMHSETEHAVAISASQTLGHSGSSKGIHIQADRYVIALAYLVWCGEIRLTPGNGERKG